MSKKIKDILNSWREDWLSGNDYQVMLTENSTNPRRDIIARVNEILSRGRHRVSLINTFSFLKRYGSYRQVASVNNVQIALYLTIKNILFTDRKLPVGSFINSRNFLSKARIFDSVIWSEKNTYLSNAINHYITKLHPDMARSPEFRSDDFIHMMTHPQMGPIVMHAAALDFFLHFGNPRRITSDDATKEYFDLGTSIFLGKTIRDSDWKRVLWPFIETTDNIMDHNWDEGLRNIENELVETQRKSDLEWAKLRQESADIGTYSHDYEEHEKNQYLLSDISQSLIVTRGYIIGLMKDVEDKQIFVFPGFYNRGVVSASTGQDTIQYAVSSNNFDLETLFPNSIIPDKFSYLEAKYGQSAYLTPLDYIKLPKSLPEDLNSKIYHHVLFGDELDTALTNLPGQTYIEIRNIEKNWARLGLLDKPQQLDYPRIFTDVNMTGYFSEYVLDPDTDIRYNAKENISLFNSEMANATSGTKAWVNARERDHIYGTSHPEESKDVVEYLTKGDGVIAEVGDGAMGWNLNIKPDL